jgi:Arc/MetJ family transcription regulator
MPTNLQIDDELLVRAQRVGRFRTKKDTVNQALADFLRRYEQRAVTELFGSVDFDPGFDHKALREKR